MAGEGEEEGGSLEGYEERKKARTNNWKAATTESRVLPEREQRLEGRKKEERETQPTSFTEVKWRRAELSWSPGKEDGKGGKEGQVSLEVRKRRRKESSPRKVQRRKVMVKSRKEDGKRQQEILQPEVRQEILRSDL